MGRKLSAKPYSKRILDFRLEKDYQLISINFFQNIEIIIKKFRKIDIF